MVQSIPLTRIRGENKLQSRVQLDLFTSTEYAEAMKAGQIFPPIDVVFDGEIYWLWDGYHRKRAAEIAGLDSISAQITEGGFDKARWLALGANVKHGRQRTNADKRRVVELAFGHPYFAEEIEKYKRPNFSQMARHCGVNETYVRNIWYILHPKDVSEIVENSDNLNFQQSLKLNGKSPSIRPDPAEHLTPQAFEALKNNDIAEDKREIAKLAKLDTETQQEVTVKLLSGEAKSVKAAAKKVTTEKLIAEIKNTTLPQGKYYVIAIDPPWKYDNRPDDDTHRAANPYPSMDVDEIKELDIPSLTLDDCILWLWVTNAFMCEAHQIARHWGFEVKTILTWVKSNMGIGDWLRGKTEHCLMCIKGKPVVNLTNQTTVIHGPLREHSRKPDEFYALVEELCPGSKVELFARQQRPGWKHYGNETSKFD